jgi:hypothetical protein
MRKKIVIVKRGEDGIAILDTPKKRILFVLMLLFCFVFFIISYVTPIWLIYWIFTGNHLGKMIFDTDEI